ncbi:MAG: cyclodeaminase/cyclohydrolase family protein [Candidatus Omnitrophica bacterium]|nr:cyclodeaminase/cyclohydrolase family protein [Candidatus Omnitrophota bacterium]
MKYLKDYSIEEYTNALSLRVPTPGGGSAAALTAALGTALFGMVARYSLDRGSTREVEHHIKKIVKECDKIQQTFLRYVDDDAKAYQRVVKARKGTKQQQKAADNAARKIQQKVRLLCYRMIALAPFLVKKGNPHLAADVGVAGELLLSAYNSAEILA